MFFVTFATASAPAHADWKVQPATEFDEEVRVWATPKESDLDFWWSGKVNARHEAEGYGVLEWLKEAEPRPQTILLYTGEMKSGRRHGRGVALYRSGSKYSGQWSENLKEGNGEYWYSNGDYYAGSFHNDLMHGLGRYVSADGTVFEGNFIADERDGPRVVIYPDGRRYASTWSTGKHISPSGAPASAKPYLMLGVDVRRYALDGDIFTRDERGEDDLTYLGRFAAGDFVIESDWPFWVAWSKGGPVVIGEGGFEDFESESFPCFSTSASSTRPREKLVIRKAEAVVEESVPDFEPILRLHDASRIYGGVTCGIVNFGWGRVDDCEVAFNILPRDAEPKFENYQFVEKVEPFSERATFSLARAMEALGMDVDAIAAIEHLKEDDDPARESVAVRATREMRRFPKFVKLDDDVFSAYGLIAGEVRIAWTDHSGSKQAKRVKFQLSKCFSLFWPEIGSGGPSSGKYDLLLETEGKDYVVPFAYKRTLAPGANDRFTLQIASQVSTYQQFRIRLTTAEGREIISPRCRMHFLVPRTFSWREGYLIEKEPL